MDPSLLPTGGALPAGVWRADRLAPANGPTLPSQFAVLDRALPGGGWPVGSLTELLLSSPGCGELRLLAPVLQALTRAGRTVILLAPPQLPYPPALSALGIHLDHLILVKPTALSDQLWAVEQALRSARFGGLLAWLPHPGTRIEHLRRLQRAAQGAQGPAFVFRPAVTRAEASPAPLRLLLTPLPGQQLAVDLLKRRGPPQTEPVVIDLPLPASTLRPGRRAALMPAATAQRPQSPSGPVRLKAAHLRLPETLDTPAPGTAPLP